jgi:hypothetical protein
MMPDCRLRSPRSGRIAGLLALVLLVPPAGAAPGGQPPPSLAAATYLPAAMRAHVAFLADDLLEGRGTGSRGHEIAARYVAAQLAVSGLEAGADGQWLQPVPLRRYELEGSTLELRTPAGEISRLVAGSDYVTDAGPRPFLEVEGPVVFVGYGITTPEMGRDDYAGLDAREAIVAFLGGTPADLPPEARSRYGDFAAKASNAVAHGAAGILRLWSPEEEKAGSWETVGRSLGSGASLRLRDAKERGGASAQLRGNCWLGPRATALLLGAGVASRDAAGTTESPQRPRRLPLRALIATKSRFTDLESHNVVGLWRGDDPALRDEYVVVSAHLDHLGIGPPVDGDAIYNGAVDNASGVATLLEVARAVAARNPPPKRSLLFLATTGEEDGNLGAEHFLSHPPVPAERLVADLNLDGGGMWPFDGLVGRGAEHSTLAGAVAAGAALAGVPVAPDPMPERFSGSDQYSFALAGVPALIFANTRSGAARAQVLDWFRNRYHAPSDDLGQPLDFEAAARFTRAVLEVVGAVADAPRRPVWNPGDVFARPAAPP